MLNKFVKQAEKEGWPIYGIEVNQNGKLIAKYNFRKEERYPIYSATKSFLSTAVGIAVDEKMIDLEEKLISYFRDFPLSKEQIDYLSQVSIKRLLTMSVPGYPFRPETESWLEFSLKVPISYSEIPVFSYSNISAYLVGVALERAIGKNVGEFLEEKLFSKIDILNPILSYCPEGHFYGASGMYLTVHELSRLGELYLQKGSYYGKRILSEEWVQQATKKQIETREGGYGYFFWMFGNKGYRISGKWGQRCFILPERQMTITYLGNLKEEKEKHAVEHAIGELLMNFQ